MGRGFLQKLYHRLFRGQNNDHLAPARSELPVKSTSPRTLPEAEQPTSELNTQAVMKALETQSTTSTTLLDNIPVSRRNDPAISGTLGYITQKALVKAIAVGLDADHIKAMLSQKAKYKGDEGVRRSKYGFELIVFTPQGPCQFIGKLKNDIIAFDTFVAHTEYVYS